MPIAAEDVLSQLIEAAQEARKTIRELHEARAASNDIMKKQKKEIADQIKKEVETQVNKISEDIQVLMVDEANKIMLGIEKDWREKLGLDVPS